MELIFKRYIHTISLAILILIAYQGSSFSKNPENQKSDSLVSGKNNSTDTLLKSTNFNTFKILTNLKDEQQDLANKLYNFQNEMGIAKGLELQVLEIYVDKTSEDKSKWNVIINDTILQFTPALGWSELSVESMDLLDNWSGIGEKTNLEFNKVYSVDAKPNEMFRVIAFPLLSMGEDSKLSKLQKDYSYEVIIVDDFPEQVEIQPKPGLIFKRVDNNRFRIKLSRFNRAEFDRWSKNKDEPFIYTTSIILYDKISNVKSFPVNLRFTFGEY